ncbi:MAG TPA: FecR domain-containing protein [Puia sp.]|jgi:ferric-dicitrate binding protein FerR (iron transport regulator)|nr:FecR domain-containing protein [Puia sp.]
MDEFSTNRNDRQGLPFGFRRKPLDERVQEENWAAVENGIRQTAATPAGMTEVAPVRAIRGRWVLKVVSAAAAIAALVIGIWWVSTRTGHPEEMAVIKTGYGEIKNILLPDSSVVVLNANSSLRMSSSWTETGGRQVWLEGEAYFQVQKKASTARKFVVHTKEVDVEVLGTRFNVNTRRQRAIVSLEEGKVRLSMNGIVTAVMEKKAGLVMRPGQVAEVDEDLQAKVNEDKDVSTRSGWSRHEFHFDHTSLGEIAHLVQDTYGYEMVVEDSSMLEKQISDAGGVRVSDVKDLVKVLMVASGYNMQIREKKIYVTGH